MTQSENVLVVAFDGLDKELIEEFELENIPQKEFGKIDNTTGISQILTSELYASFITGKNSQGHGVYGGKTYQNEFKGKIMKTLAPDNFVSNIRGFHTFKNILEQVLEVDRLRHHKPDLETDTLFEKIENSKAMFIPSYNPSVFWRTEADMEPLRKGYSIEETLENYDTREHEHRKRALFKELDSNVKRFLMCHIHRSDMHQHIYGTPGMSTWDKDKLRELYADTDRLAGKILSKAEDKYDTIIFMSDHGLPDPESGHNENAFYSCNKELFGDKMPKITDFHDLIIASENENGLKNIQI